MSLFWFPVNDNLGYYFTGYVIISIVCSLLEEEKGPLVPKGGRKRRFEYMYLNKRPAWRVNKRLEKNTHRGHVMTLSTLYVIPSLVHEHIKICFFWSLSSRILYIAPLKPCGEGVCTNLHHPTEICFGSSSSCNLKSLCIFCQHIKQQLTRFFFLMVLLRLSPPPSGATTPALSCEWRRMREARRRLHIKDNTHSFLLATIVIVPKIRNWLST